MGEYMTGGNWETFAPRKEKSKDGKPETVGGPGKGQGQDEGKKIGKTKKGSP